MAKYPVNAQDPYLEPDTGALRNRLNIADQDTLDRAEALFAAIRDAGIAAAQPPAKFDLDHLQNIHRSLFGDVYSWAGELRTVNISKGNTQFAYHGAIESAANDIFRQLARENNLRGLDREAFSNRAGYYLGEMNVLHPFREGNGRAQRVFINQIAWACDYHIAWSGVSRDEMTRASIEAYDGNAERMAALILTNLTDRDQARAVELARSVVGDLGIGYAEVGERYVGRIISATERYIVQERHGEIGAMILHNRYNVKGNLKKMQGKIVEIHYPQGKGPRGNIRLVHDLTGAGQEMPAQGPEKTV